MKPLPLTLSDNIAESAVDSLWSRTLAKSGWRVEEGSTAWGNEGTERDGCLVAWLACLYDVRRFCFADMDGQSRLLS